MKHTRTNGFTLIEMVLYMGIFSLIISSIVGLAMVATAQRVKSQVIADVTYQGEALMSSMTQAVRGASSVTTPAQGTTNATLQLNTPYAATTPTIYDATTNGGVMRLRLREGVTPTTNYLSNSHVVLSNLSFSNNGLTNTKGSIKISFTLTYVNPNGRDEYNYSKNFFGGANLP